MQREESIVVHDLQELLRIIAERVAQFGPLDLLYMVGRA
jgi:hypothetical protein